MTSFVVMLKYYFFLVTGIFLVTGLMFSYVSEFHKAHAFPLGGGGGASTPRLVLEAVLKYHLERHPHLSLVLEAVLKYHLERHRHLSLVLEAVLKYHLERHLQSNNLIACHKVLVQVLMMLRTLDQQQTQNQRIPFKGGL